LWKDEFAQRDRYVKENIEVLAKRLGEMQAKMLQLESLGERVFRLGRHQTRPILPSSRVKVVLLSVAAISLSKSWTLRSQRSMGWQVSGPM